MVAESNKKPEKTDADKHFLSTWFKKTPPPKPAPMKEITWTGMQLIQRVKGTKEIYFRSFPFWGPGEDWAIQQAKKTNRLKGQDRTFWTHLLVFAEITENDEGHQLTQINTIKEVQL